MLYRPGSTFFHRSDPRAKLFTILVVLALALSTTRLDVLLALTAIVIVALAIGAGLTPRSYWKALVVILPLIALLTLLQSLVQGGPAAFSLGSVGFSRHGILLGLALGTRLMAMGICFYGFSVTTSPSDISLALNRLGVPYKFSYLTSFAFRFLPLMQDEARTLLTAMSVRGSDEGTSPNPFRRGKAIVRMLFPMLMGSLKRSGDISLSMELRGYGLKGPRTCLRSLHFHGRDVALVLTMVLVVVAAVLVQWQVPNPLAVR
ncbi:energy-coupling factor transporter transmembrane component T family protein [Ruania albidiflava]|uniref:energy-coupling factor transporter transmembrane component T family protein n=1 Tax=Ruania albidiflava TaxID=366586 RepID=UPI0003B409F6|nr:energy-coupling factor transporter transmembrane component T [Ruania albidiflava]